MKNIAVKTILYLSLACLAFQLTSCNKPAPEVKNPITEEPDQTEMADGKFPYKWLSTYGFFEGDLADLKPKEQVVLYRPASSLFTDYAQKSRFISVPASDKITIEDGELNFPVGTILIKNFYYPSNFQNPDAERKIIETRLLIQEEDGWEAYPYIWNEEQTNAVLKVVGGEREVQFRDVNGEDQVINYLIPNKNQCKTCHNKSESLQPIGLKIKHLNFEIDWVDAGSNQLAHWQELGILEGFEGKENYPAMIDYNDSDQVLADRAMAYLDINCSHCHSQEGPASTSGLFLTFDQKDPMKLGIMKTPVAAGNGAGSFDFDIFPGKADESILVHRMNSTEVGTAMPELGRTTIHKEGVELIRAWIDEMKK